MTTARAYPVLKEDGLGTRLVRQICGAKDLRNFEPLSDAGVDTLLEVILSFHPLWDRLHAKGEDQEVLDIMEVLFQSGKTIPVIWQALHATNLDDRSRLEDLTVLLALE